jgi:hypothetical protein
MIKLSSRNGHAVCGLHNLFSCPRVALRYQLVQFGALLGNPVGDPLFILTARCAGRLFDQLPEIVAKDGDAIVKLGKRKIVRHRHDSLFVAILAAP